MLLMSCILALIAQRYYYYNCAYSLGTWATFRSFTSLNFAFVSNYSAFRISAR
jgi:hypothetical protein